MRMHTVHERQKKSATRWMGCKPTTKEERINNEWERIDRRNEKYEDLPEMYDDDYDNREIEVSSTTSTLGLVNKLLIISTITLCSLINRIKLT